MQRQRTLTIAVGLVAAMAAVAERPAKQVYGPHDQAYYLPKAVVDIARPGLVITIQSASIASNGTISVTYTIADPSGLPLDIAGVTTPGPVTLSFLAAYIPKGQEQYVSYITRTATGTVIASTTQPTADSGGTTTTIATGQYTYTFKNTAPSGFDPTVTNTIGIYGSRNLTSFNLDTAYASTTYNFVPNGSPVTVTRDVIRTASCDACHDQLSYHGGSRRGINLCVMCHTPQNTDPNTGNTLDLKVMVHKIHMGSSLPSVVAGGTYEFVGFQNAISNFSTVVDPAMAQRCTVCHSQTTGAAQATSYMTEPTRLVCGSCHDNVNFATGANHPGGAQPNDSQCSTCHIPQGSSDFDASIVGAHVVTTDSSLLSGLKASITSITGGTAGTAPTVNFTLTDNKGNGVPTSALGSLSLTMAGPTTDYGYTIFGTSTSTPGYVTESATKTATCSAGGACTYTFTNVVPKGSTGTYAIGIEATRTETVLSGQPNQMSISYGAANPVGYFSVDGSTVAPRRTVVVESNCNQCHYELSAHGILRNNVVYCVMCHNPSNTDASTRAAAAAPYNTQPAQGINFNLLVHRIHFGPNAATDGTKNPYIVIGHSNTPVDLSMTRYPAFYPTGPAGDTRNCSLCHTNGSEQNLPVGLNKVVDPQGWVNPNQPVSDACSGCHTSIQEAAHMVTQTTTLGESCTVCHASGAAYAVDQVHAQY